MLANAADRSELLASMRNAPNNRRLGQSEIWQILAKWIFMTIPPTARERGSPRPSTGLQCLALPCTSFGMTSEQSRQRLADFGCFMRVAHRNAPDYGIYGLLDFWQIFGKTVF